MSLKESVYNILGVTVKVAEWNKKRKREERKNWEGTRRRRREMEKNN
jgi:hypothetical protein